MPRVADGADEMEGGMDSVLVGCCDGMPLMDGVNDGDSDGTDEGMIDVDGDREGESVGDDDGMTVGWIQVFPNLTEYSYPKLLLPYRSTTTPPSTMTLKPPGESIPSE